MLEVINNDYSSELEKSKLTKASFVQFGAPVCGSPSYRLYMQVGRECSLMQLLMSVFGLSGYLLLGEFSVQGLSGFGAPISQQCLKAVYEVFISNRAEK